MHISAKRSAAFDSKSSPAPSRRYWVAVSTGVLIIVVCMAVWQAEAATIVVDSELDENQSTPTNFSCTLREAVLAANGNLVVDGCAAGEAAPVIDVIQIPAGHFQLTIAETGDATGGSLVLTEDVQLVAAGLSDSTLDGLGADIQVLLVHPGVVAGVSGLTVTGSDWSSAVIVEGELTLTGCRVSDNSDGGVATSNGGVLVVEGCLIDNNGTFGVSNNPSGDATITATTISGNGDAGIVNHSYLLVDGATITDNKHGVVGYGSWQILNSTISGNDGTSGTSAGAGLILAMDGVALVNNCTITGNVNDYGSGIYVNSASAVMQVQNTIVADNPSLSSDCFIWGTLISTGGNIEGLGNTCGFNQATDRVNVSMADLALGPLLNHGGPTRVHGLEPQSVAIDAGVNSGPAAGCPASDQRGLPRSDGLCDVGSVEVQPGEDMKHLFADGFESGDTSGWSRAIQ